MKVEAIKIKNFKAISSENLEINGNNVYVLGPNGVGKSSFIDSIFKIISGKDLPSKPSKDGTAGGSVELDMGDLILKAKFNAKNEKISLEVTSKDVASYGSPRTMLDNLAGVVDFNINDFFVMTPKKQVEFIKQLVGIDFTDLDDEYKKLYEERTYVNRTIKDLEAKCVYYDNNLTESDRVVVSELSQKLQAANESNNKFNDVLRRKEERKKEIADMEAKVAELKSLQTQADEWLKGRELITTEEIEQTIKDAEETNKSVDNSILGRKLDEELRKASTSCKELNDKMSTIETSKLTAISECKLPGGLTFDENGLYLNGLPFERSQINTAQQIIIGLQINLVLLKDIRIARFDGSLLDNKNMEEVEEWAKENDLQLFVEFVERDSEGLKIEIQE